MTVWRPLPAERLFLYSPVGFRLVDDLTGQAPFGALDIALDVQNGADWREGDRDAVTTASGVVIFPGLGLAIDLTQPALTHRLRVTSPYYRPLFRATSDGLSFAVPPWDHAHPPAPLTTRTTPLALLPAAAYPFAPHLAVLRGVVEDVNGNPVADVLVQEGLRERTLTDERGAFSLSLRWVVPGVATTITATDQRGARSGSIAITLPGALISGQTITVS
ncbi:MAG: carboxypeptidase regulatory-like domain-containing protein [Acidobacteria bacterium]|nr:carboxypeptidase regulatory-like domain-containing protein [Acidobacteriota bacterium]